MSVINEIAKWLFVIAICAVLPAWLAWRWAGALIRALLSYGTAALIVVVWFACLVNLPWLAALLVIPAGYLAYWFCRYLGKENWAARATQIQTDREWVKGKLKRDGEACAEPPAQTPTISRPEPAATDAHSRLILALRRATDQRGSS